MLRFVGMVVVRVVEAVFSHGKIDVLVVEGSNFA